MMVGSVMVSVAGAFDLPLPPHAQQTTLTLRGDWLLSMPGPKGLYYELYRSGSLARFYFRWPKGKLAQINMSDERESKWANYQGGSIAVGWGDGRTSAYTPWGEAEAGPDGREPTFEEFVCDYVAHVCKVARLNGVG